MKASYTYAPGEWGTLAQEWRRSLEADNKSANTVRIYLHAVRKLGDWASSQPEPLEPTTITAQGIRDYVRALLDRSSAGNAHNHYRCLRTFFGRLVDEEELGRSPMERTRAPQVPEKQIPIVTIEQMRALLDTCKGKDFTDRRDTAILRVLWDTGSRRAEVTYLGLDDVDLDTEAILVQGKGRRSRVIPSGAKTGQALSRYLRVRSRHRLAELPALWIGPQGPLTHNGLKEVLTRRGDAADVGHIHPHLFRHALAHRWQVEGGNENDLMRIMGWKSREMLNRYGASAADARARAAARALRLGDRV